MSNIIENRSNFNPNVWGPKAWFFLDTIALSYPQTPTDSDKYNYANFLDSIGTMLPCAGCRDNYKKHLIINPITDKVLESNNNLLDWWIKIHNMARVTMNKNIINYDDFIKYYAKCYNNDTTDTNDNRDTVRNIVYLCIFIILVMWFKDIFLNKK